MIADEVQNATVENQNINGRISKEMAEFVVEGNKSITLHVEQEEKNNLGAAESAHDIMKVVKSIIGIWNKEKGEVFVMDRNERRIGVDEDWTNGVRTIGREGKRKVDMFAKIKTLKPLHELK